MDQEARREAETKEIILAVVESHTPEGVEEEDLLKIVNWIVTARTDRSLLQLFEAKKIRIGWRDGEPTFARREEAGRQ